MPASVLHGVPQPGGEPISTLWDLFEINCPKITTLNVALRLHSVFYCKIFVGNISLSFTLPRTHLMIFHLPWTGVLLTGVGFSDVEDTAEAGVMLTSSQRPIHTRPSLRKMLGGDHREPGRRKACIWDTKAPSFQLPHRCHELPSQRLYSWPSEEG